MIAPRSCAYAPQMAYQLGRCGQRDTQRMIAHARSAFIVYSSGLFYGRGAAWHNNKETR
jgi:hypothetical protein